MKDFEKFTAETEKFRKSKIYQERYLFMMSYLMHYCCGKKNARMSKVICAAIGVSDVQLRSLVKHARSQGIPIGSSGEGYFMAQSYPEIEATIEHLTSRLTSLAKTVAKLKICFPDESQTELKV